MIITLDGPCGSGKSTLAQKLAHQLGFFYINSGYLYRSLAYILVEEFDYTTEQLQSPASHHVQHILDEAHFIYEYKNGIVQIFFKGSAITHHLKTTTVSDHASLISADFMVRQAIVALQKKFGAMYNIVTDGRDGGTEIYPHAEFKFYVIAHEEIRARRLQADFEKTGKIIDFHDVLHMTQMRDARDMTRLISPLKKAHDAIEIDTSHRSVQEILDTMILMIKNI